MKTVRRGLIVVIAGVLYVGFMVLAWFLLILHVITRKGR